MSLESFLSWSGKPESGLHLDVMKDNKLVNKIMVDDEKGHYIFGRDPNLNETCLNHASCSRKHAVLVYHKHLKRFFLIDLGSRYGTFIGKTRIEANKPTQLQPDMQFSFGESTRYFILREKPVQLQISKKGDGSNAPETLPENELELNNLTEFNTAHNKQISMLRVSDTEIIQRGKRKKKSVNFTDVEEIINIDEIDPTVGKFRNLVQTSIVLPNKKIKTDPSFVPFTSTSSSSDLSSKSSFDFQKSNSFNFNDFAFAGVNSAPEVNFDLDESTTRPLSIVNFGSLEPKHENRSTEKKKYAKEKWIKDNF